MMRKNNSNRTYMPDRKIRWAFIFSVAALILFFAVLYQQKGQQENTRKWVSHTNQTISTIDTIGILVSETEAGIREYIATKDPAWKKQVRQLHFHLTLSLEALQRLTIDNRIQQSNVEKIKKLFAQKIALQDKILSDAFTGERLRQKLSRQWRGATNQPFLLS
jgi:CHASE3 domain sensor protein